MCSRYQQRRGRNLSNRQVLEKKRLWVKFGVDKDRKRKIKEPSSAARRAQRERKKKKKSDQRLSPQNDTENPRGRSKKKNPGGRTGSRAKGTTRLLQRAGPGQTEKDPIKKPVRAGITEKEGDHNPQDRTCYAGPKKKLPSSATVDNPGTQLHGS